MGSFAQSLYAQMIRGRELDRQRQLEQKRYDDAQASNNLQRALIQEQAANQEKQKAFDRQLSVAKLQQENAALLGKAYEGGYMNPVIGEYAQASYDAGKVAAGKLAAEHALKMRGQDMTFRTAQLNALLGAEQSGYAKLTPEARDTYVPQLADTSRALPTANGPLTMREDEANIRGRHAARGGIDFAIRLRDQLHSEPLYKEFQAVKAAHNRMAVAGNNGAGDVNALYTFVKMLDSSSAVREGEVGLAEAVAGLRGKIASWLAKADGRMLDPGIVTQLKAEADRLFGAAQRSYKPLADHYEAEAQHNYGLEPGRISWEFFDAPGPLEKNTKDAPGSGNSNHRLDQLLGE